MMRRWESGGLEPVGTRDHARGPRDAPVTLVKYGDYECPYCAEAHPLLKELQERVGEQVRFVFRHFPLDSTHPVPALPLRPRRRPPLRAASGRCTTSSTSVKTNSAKKS
jgi:thiol-disulfide isomerase/thioredoxin